MLTASLSKDNVVKWEAEVKAWEADPYNRDDPYVVDNQGMQSRIPYWHAHGLTVPDRTDGIGDRPRSCGRGAKA